MDKKIFCGLFALLAFSVSASSSEYIISVSAPGVYKKAERVDGLRSCLDILKAKPSSKSGNYTIKPDGNKEFSVYCDMTSMGGGWTLIDVSSARAQKSLISYAELAKISTEIAFGHSVESTPKGLVDMKYGLSFKIPDPSIVTFDNSKIDAKDSVAIQLASKFGLSSGSMSLANKYYVSKYALGFKYTIYHHYGVTDVQSLSNYTPTAFSNAMGHDGYAMVVANGKYQNAGFLFVYLR